jgi:hypothetical protein
MSCTENEVTEGRGASVPTTNAGPVLAPETLEDSVPEAQPVAMRVAAVRARRTVRSLAWGLRVGFEAGWFEEGEEDCEKRGKEDIVHFAFCVLRGLLRTSAGVRSHRLNNKIFYRAAEST